MKPFERKSRPGGRDSRDSGRSFGGGSSYGGGGGGGSSYDRDRGSSFGGQSRAPMGLHKAVCAQCGMNCEVPFKPTGERPVLCKNCFVRDDRPAQRASHLNDTHRFASARPDRSEQSYDRPQRSFDRPSDSAPRGGSDPAVLKQLAAINTKLTQILEILGESEEEIDAE